MLKLFVIIVIFIIAIPFLLIIYNSFGLKIDLNDIIIQKADIRLYDSNNTLLDSKFLYRYIEYKDISSHIVNAFVALEDKRFFKHNGVDYYRTAGAFAHNLRSGKIKEGGSTITQQLAKNTLLSSEKTYKRKIKEMKLAHAIEKKFSKEQIMEMYLNAIYYGNGIYGIDSACYNYFGKEPSDLTPVESAILAGIVKNPSRYSPAKNTEEAMKRKDLVLRLMLEQGYLTEEEYTDGSNYVYKPFTPEPDPIRPYYTSVLHEAASILGITEKELIRSSYKINTYCNSDKLNKIYASFKSGQYVSVNKNDISASYSVLLADNDTGGISAYYSTDDNNIFLFRRSPASAIKPILVYAPALEYGVIHQKSLFNDQKTEFNGYTPKNFGDNYAGVLSAEKALALSSNTVAVQILQKTGIERSIEIAQQAGLRFDKEDNHLALALGGMTYGVTMPELCEGYMTIARGGTHTNTTFIRSIETESGEVIYCHKPQHNRVLSSSTAYILTDMLKKTVSNGTAGKLKGFSYDIAAKTGTAESSDGADNSDAWNVSYTTADTLCVWYGSQTGKNNSAIETTGGNYPTLLAADIRRKMPSPHQTTFSMPRSVYEYEIDTYALEKEGKLYFSTDSTPKKYREKGLFTATEAPKESSPYFSISDINFEIDVRNGIIYVSADSPSPFRYKLIEKNLYTGAIREFSDLKSPLPKAESHSLYSYYLAVYYDSQLMGYTPNKLYFT